MAEIRHQSVMLHCGEELATPIALAFDVVGRVEHLPAIGLYELGLISERLPYANGMLTPFNGPGHGVVFDVERLGDLRRLE
ncbi:MAG: hypothetical protein C7B45_17355 [Sulfobacillus acidophilus]|uniref:Uncharacterized protein n=1 Tax=Sulfobacillus acidophilus TaxID=53633 RepID=A0A2T2WCK3_9FIRM|nr:MAG: hypothetical protein C7B45_17355 [Sulfobacillus acidophilus]